MESTGGEMNKEGEQDMCLLSLNEAAAKGIGRLRRPIWAIPMDHIKMDTQTGKVPLSIYLYSPFNQECNGRDPVEIFLGGGALGYDPNEKAWMPYKGPLPDSEEYRAARDEYKGSLSGEPQNHTTQIEGA